MSHWNYRIVRTRETRTPVAGGEYEQESYALHEVYYDDDGSPIRMTAEPTTFGGETREEMVEALALALHDAIRRPILDRDDIGE